MTVQVQNRDAAAVRAPRATQLLFAPRQRRPRSRATPRTLPRRAAARCRTLRHALTRCCDALPYATRAATCTFVRGVRRSRAAAVALKGAELGSELTVARCRASCGRGGRARPACAHMSRRAKAGARARPRRRKGWAPEIKLFEG